MSFSAWMDAAYTVHIAMIVDAAIASNLDGVILKEWKIRKRRKAFWLKAFRWFFSSCSVDAVVGIFTPELTFFIKVVEINSGFPEKWLITFGEILRLESWSKIWWKVKNEKWFFSRSSTPRRLVFTFQFFADFYVSEFVKVHGIGIFISKIMDEPADHDWGFRNNDIDELLTCADPESIETTSGQGTP